MNSQPSSPRALSFSSSLYELLLRAYPREFRDEYGPHMRQVFRDRCRQRLRESSGTGLLLWWIVTLIDFVGSVIQQHLGKESHVIVPGYVRAAGWALVVGALCLLGFFMALLMIPSQENDPRWYVSMSFLFIGTLLVPAGTVVVREQLGSTAGPAGRAVLLFGALSSLLILTGFSNVWDAGMPWSVLPMLGPALLLASLATFGLLSLRSRALPTSLAWNLVPGFWLLLLIVGAIIADALGLPYETGSWWRIPGVIGTTLTCIALVRLGFVLISGRRQQLAGA